MNIRGADETGQDCFKPFLPGDGLFLLFLRLMLEAANPLVQAEPYIDAQLSITTLRHSALDTDLLVVESNVGVC